MKHFDCQFPWEDSRRLSRRQFINMFVMNLVPKPKHEMPSFKCKSSAIYHFWDQHGNLWRCWNYHVWPARENPHRIVLNTYQYNLRFSDLDYVLEEQPAYLAQDCDFDPEAQNHSQLATWRCSRKHISEQKYLPGFF